jgi:hypothetical protein
MKEKTIDENNKDLYEIESWNKKQKLKKENEK